MQLLGKWRVPLATAPAPATNRADRVYESDPLTLCLCLWLSVCVSDSLPVCCFAELLVAPICIGGRGSRHQRKQLRCRGRRGAAADGSAPARSSTGCHFARAARSGCVSLTLACTLSRMPTQYFYGVRDFAPLSQLLTQHVLGGAEVRLVALGWLRGCAG